MTHQLAVLWAALALGLAFGALAQRSAFCLTGGLREWWCQARPRRAAAFLLAMAVAVAGTQALGLLGAVDLRGSLYLESGFSWLLIPAGGLLFGYGMVLANGCGSRALVLLGSGNLRSLVVLLCLGIAAYAALTGVLAPLRLSVAEATTLAPALPSPSLPGVLEAWGVAPGLARLAPAALIAGALAVIALAGLGLRGAPGQALAAVAIGALIPAGWLITGRLGADEFEPVALQSLTFVAPVGDGIQYLMLATGMPLEFGVAVVAGVPLGAAAVALLSGGFALRGFDSRTQLVRAIAGGTLMGLGGALALGCSIGQGLTGVSTLALPSFLAVAGLLAGAFLALRGPLRAAERGAHAPVQG